MLRQAPGISVAFTNRPEADRLSPDDKYIHDLRVAVIDQHVCTEGDIIEGYKVFKIDMDRVWLDGPGGVEVLQFSSQRQNNTAAQPPLSKPTPPAK